MVTVALKSVHITLDAPVTVWISKKSKEEVIEHEMAHVEICKRVYKNDAPKIASESIKKALERRTYQASGGSTQEAVGNALAITNKEICQYYHLKMVEKVNRVSEIFDSIEHDLKEPLSKVVDIAFDKYSVVKPKAESK